MATRAAHTELAARESRAARQERRGPGGGGATRAAHIEPRRTRENGLRMGRAPQGDGPTDCLRGAELRAGCMPGETRGWRRRGTKSRAYRAAPHARPGLRMGSEPQGDGPTDCMRGAELRAGCTPGETRGWRRRGTRSRAYRTAPHSRGELRGRGGGPQQRRDTESRAHRATPHARAEQELLISSRAA